MMTATESDEHVMLRLAGGEEAAIGELMRRWEGPIWYLIDRMCGKLGVSDDVYQEVWTRLFLHRRRYNPNLQFRPYLFAIAANCCRSALWRGRADRRFVTPLEDSPDAPSASDPPPIDAVIAREQGELLHEAVARLPLMQRTVVLLYLVFDTSYERIARVLGRSPVTVRSHMHHALKNLRATLTKVALKSPESQVDHERLAD